MRLQRYRFNLTYNRGPTLHLADTLSLATLPQPVAAKVTHFYVFRVEMVSEHNSRNPKPGKDITLSALYKEITHGWPEGKATISESLRLYWNYRGELSVQNGIIYKCTQVMLPQSMHKELLCKIHANHFGRNQTYVLACEVLCWPSSQ